MSRHFRKGSGHNRSNNGSNSASLVLFCGLLSMASIALALCWFSYRHVQSSAELLEYLDDHRVAAAAAAAAMLSQPAKATSYNAVIHSGNNDHDNNNDNKNHLPAEPSLAKHLVQCNALRQSQAMKQTDPNAGVQHLAVVNQSPAPTFRMSLHQEAFDPMRWTLHNKGRYYEKKLEQSWSNVLRDAPPHARVLDVGGNIGYFSFYSAAHGGNKPIHVDTFEPNPLNLLRACETLEANQWSHEYVHDDDTTTSATAPTVNLWQWGISDQVGQFAFAQNSNPGAGQFANDKDEAEKITGATNVTMLDVTTLDEFAAARGWLDAKDNSVPRIEILKIDVEHLENFVLFGAEALIKARLIRNLFMEWSITRVEWRQERPRKAMQILLDAGYTLCAWGGYLGPAPEKSLPFNGTDHEHFMENFFHYSTKRRSGALNVWWQSDPQCRYGGPQPYKEE